MVARPHARREFDRTDETQIAQLGHGGGERRSADRNPRDAARASPDFDEKIPRLRRRNPEPTVAAGPRVQRELSQPIG